VNNLSGRHFNIDHRTLGREKQILYLRFTLEDQGENFYSIHRDPIYEKTYIHGFKMDSSAGDFHLSLDQWFLTAVPLAHIRCPAKIMKY